MELIDAKVVAFVHAKGTSERLPGKNLRVLGDRPLFCHAIRNAREAKLVDAVVIDSDSDEILRIGEEHGAIPLKRPVGLATNDATGDDLAYWQALHCQEDGVLVQVVPTSPFTRSASISAAVDAVLNQSRAAVGVIRRVVYRHRPNGPEYYREGRIPNSQAMDVERHETTGLYAVAVDFVVENRRRMLLTGTVPVDLTPVEAISIDTEEDWQLAELVWKGMQC